MQTSPVAWFRETFYSRWSWWLLLLTFALTFFSPDRGAAGKLYRLFIALPALLMLSAPMITGLKEIKSVRWLALLSLYFLLSIFWSGEMASFDNHLLRILSVWGFVLLLYYISLYQPEMFERIDLVLLGFGLVWLCLVVADWDSLWNAHLHNNIISVSRGVFYHHRPVGWMLAVLSLLSLQRMFRKESRSLLWSPLTLVFFIALIFTQARGGLLVFFAGLIAFCFSGQVNLRLRSIIIVIAGLLLTIGVSYVFFPEVFVRLIERGTAGRFNIWQNWYNVWQGDVVKVVFGHGLGASAENIILKQNALIPVDKVIPHYHNFYLNNFFYGGMVGIMMLIAWVFSVLKSKNIKTKDYMPWFAVLCGTLTGFLTDGDKLFNYPGAFMFCFILPVFCIVFANQRPSVNEEIHAN